MPARVLADILRRRELRSGLAPDAALRLRAELGVAAGGGVSRRPLRPATNPASSSAGLEVLFRPDPTIWDGSVANNAWLQELPKPLTKTVWENVITIAPKLAAQHKLANGDIAVVQADKQWIAGPVWVQPGQQPDTIGLQLGYGRQLVGSVGENIGYNAYQTAPLRCAVADRGRDLAPRQRQHRDRDGAATRSAGRSRLRADAAGRRQAGRRQ